MDDEDLLLLRLGQALRASRTELRLSQEELSLRTGVHRNYIGGIERGERNPTVVIVGRLAAALEVSLTHLLAQAEEK